MCPQPETFFIDGNQTSCAINDRTALAKGLRSLSLELTCPILQRIGLDHLQPGHPENQSEESGTQNHENDPQALRRYLREGHHP